MEVVGWVVLGTLEGPLLLRLPWPPSVLPPKLPMCSRCAVRRI